MKLLSMIYQAIKMGNQPSTYTSTFMEEYNKQLALQQTQNTQNVYYTDTWKCNNNTTYKRKGQKWSYPEEDDLINELSQKLSIYKIADKHGRSSYAIKKRIEKLIGEGKLDANKLNGDGYTLTIS